MKTAKKVLLLTLAALLIFSIASCKKAAPESKIDQIKNAGKIILGTSADYPPYEFHFDVGGKDTIVGFDIAIARQIAEDLGVELEIKDMGFDGLLAALASGNVDIVISGMTPSEERKQNVDFTDIYYKATHGILIRVADKDKYASDPASLKDVMVGAQKGAVQVNIVKEQIKGVTGDALKELHPQVKELGALPDLVMELKNKKVDAVIAELPVAKAYRDRNSDLMLADYIFNDEEGGSAIAVKKGNGSFVETINGSLAKMNAEGKIEKFVAEANDLQEKL